MIAACPKLTFICFFGIGNGNCVDVAAATKHGMTVSYTPGYAATAVAEYTLGLMRASTRHIAATHYSLKHGEWLSAEFQGVDLKRTTLGSVGLGSIGADMARLGAGIGMPRLGWTRQAAPDRAQHGLRLVSLDELFAGAHVVTLRLATWLRHSGLVKGLVEGRMGQEVSRHHRKSGGDSLYILRASML